MADIVLKRSTRYPGCVELAINGVIFTEHVFDYPELVEMGPVDFPEAGLQLTLAISRLDIEGDENVKINGRFPEVAQRVHDLVHSKDA